jgi:hypothetical protein
VSIAPGAIEKPHHHCLPAVFVVDRLVSVRDFNGATGEEIRYQSLKTRRCRSPRNSCLSRSTMSRTATRGRFTRPESSSNRDSPRDLSRALTGRLCVDGAGPSLQIGVAVRGSVGRASTAFGSIWSGSPSRRGTAAICAEPSCSSLRYAVRADFSPEAQSSHVKDGPTVEKRRGPAHSAGSIGRWCRDSDHS